MCLAIPGKIISIEGEDATISYEGEKRKVKLVSTDIKEGDYVVVQNNLILQKVPEKEAIESIKLWKEALKNES